MSTIIYHLLKYVFSIRVVEMQKYNEPLPGRHGYLANPPFYGSTLVEAANTLNHGSQGNSFRRLPSLNGDFFHPERILFG